MIAESTSHQLSLHLNIPHSETMETRASKTASDSKTSSPTASPTQLPSQIVPGPFSTVKMEPTSEISNPEIRQLLLSDEELSVVMAMRSQPSASTPTTPSCSKITEDLQKPSQVSFLTMEPLTTAPIKSTDSCYSTFYLYYGETREACHKTHDSKVGP